MRMKKGKKGAMVVKIDLEKAYDRIDKRSLEAILCQVGFQDDMVRVIMSCLSSTSISIIWNGEN